MAKNYIVTECEHHGVVSVGGLDSLRIYARIARTWVLSDDKSNTWKCCDKVVVDPEGITD